MNNGKPIEYFSTFTGIGGFELGIERAVHNRSQSARRGAGDGHSTDSGSVEEQQTIPVRCVGYSEIDKYAIKIYQKHFPEHHNFGDITGINAATLPDFNLFVGGFPCQAFSIAGKRAGFADTRGTLFFDIARILKEKRPRSVLLENVKGLLSHDSGRTFKTIIATLVELGYSVEWQVLNSKDFGVPQNRERVFIVGHFGGQPRRQVFPFGDTNEARPDAREVGEEVGIVAQTLTARQFANWGGNYVQETRIVQRARGKNIGGEFDIAPTLTGNSYEHNNTLGNIRRLTPMECERLQGFPDGWTAKGMQWDCISKLQDNWNYYEVDISDSQRYKTLGNAVTVNVVQAVCERIFMAYE